jgi:hypothetical protein
MTAAQVALLAKDAWKRKKEHRGDELRKKRRESNLAGARSYSEKVEALQDKMYENLMLRPTYYGGAWSPLVPTSIRNIGKKRPASP